MDKKDFYERCAGILGIEYTWVDPPYKRPNRWNNRNPGNGRFPGFGCIRPYGQKYHVMLHSPVRVTKILNSPNQVFELLESILESRT